MPFVFRQLGECVDNSVAAGLDCKAWIIGEESSGTQVLWVNNAHTCVMIVSA